MKLTNIFWEHFKYFFCCCKFKSNHWPSDLKTIYKYAHIRQSYAIPYIIYQLTGRGIVLSFSNAIRSAISKSWVSITKSSLNGSSEFERQTFLLLWGSLHSPESFLFFKLSTSRGPLFSSMSSPKINLAFFRVSAEILNFEPLAVVNPPKPELVSFIPDILSSFSLSCCLWWKSVRWVKKKIKHQL